MSYRNFFYFCDAMRRIFQSIKMWLQGLSFRTGVIILIVCVLCYIISFAQMLLPISSTAKLWLWVLFFGIAKATQYMALIVLGMEGWRRIKRRFSKDKNREISPK